MKAIKFGVASLAEQRMRSLAIAAGTRKKGRDEPNVWFPSIAAMARVLSDENVAILRAIREARPESMTALAKTLGKLEPNVSRSLHTMQQYGLVKLVKNGRTVKPEPATQAVTINLKFE